MIYGILGAEILATKGQAAPSCVLLDSPPASLSETPMTQNLMLLATVCMGITVMFLSSAIAVRFAMTGKVLARAFVYNLFGEFCACAGTTYFAVHQLMGTIDNVTEAWATFIRWGMFLTMLASSIHMAFVIRKIEAGKL